MPVEGATLALGLTNEPAIAGAKATGAAFEDMGMKGEAAARKIAASSSPVNEAMKRQAIEADRAARALNFVRGGLFGIKEAADPVPPALKQITDSTRQMTLTQMEAIAVNEKMSAGAVQHKLVLGRLGNQFESLIGQIAGVSPVVGKAATVLGEFAVGASLTVGILAGLAAIAYAYDKLTESSRKAMDVADKLIETYGRAARISALGAGGQQKADIEDINKGLQEHSKWLSVIIGLRTQLATMGLGGILGGDPGGHGAALSAGAVAGQQANFDLWRSLGDNWEKIAQKNKEAADKIAAAAAKALADAMRYSELLSKAYGLDRAPMSMTSADRADYNRTAAMRTMTASEMSAIMDPLTKSVLDGIKDSTSAAVSIAVGAYKSGTGQVLEQAARDITERNKKMLNEIQKDLANFFTDIFQKGIKSFGDLFSSIKDMFLRLIAEMVAANLMKRVAGMFSAFGSGGEGFLGSNRWSARGKQLAAAGFGLGAGVAGGELTGSAGGGALVGAMGGAAGGFAVGGPVGAFVGGVTGLVSGLLSGASAAREAAAAMRQLKKDYQAAVAAFKHDDLGAALAQNAAQLEQLKKTLLDTMGGPLGILLKGAAGVQAYQQALQDLDSQAAKNAEMLRRQAAQVPEDLQVRLLAAQGQDKAAAALDLAHKQARERQALIDSFGPEIDATEAATLALLDQVLAQEKLKAATDSALTSALNMVSGYRLQATIFNAMNARSPGRGSFLPPVNPLVPNTGPGGLHPPGAASGDLVVPVMLPDGTVLAKAVLKDFRRTAQRQFGDSTKWSEIQ